MMKIPTRRWKCRVTKPKNWKRQDSLPSVPVVVSSKGSPSLRKGGLSPTKISEEVSEGSSHAIALPFDIVDLIRISMCSKSIKDSSKAFIRFTKTITSKLDLSKF